MTNTSNAVATMPFEDDGEGRPLFLLHGWMMSPRVWDRLVPLFPERRLLRPHWADTDRDLEGHVEALAALVESLDLSNLQVLGHSMGAQLALLLAARIPGCIERVLLLNPVPAQGMAFPDELQTVFRNCGGNHDAIARIVGMSCLAIDDAGSELLIADGMKTDPRSVARDFDAFRLGAPAVSLERATMPVHVIATDDVFLPPAFLEDAIVSRLPNARLHHLAGAGHYPQMETPRALAELLRPMLA